MFFDSSRQINGDASIEGFVSAFEDIEIIHMGIIPRQRRAGKKPARTIFSVGLAATLGDFVLVIT